MANEDTARIWEDFLKVAKRGTKKGGIRVYKIDLCKNAIKLSDKLMEYGPISGDRLDIWVEYLGKVYEMLEGDKDTIENKTEGMSIGLVCDVKHSDLDQRYFIKCHQRGPRPTSSSISSRYNSISLPYVQELYVYKLLSLIQICGEVHFIFPQTSATKKTLYIGTREIKFTPAKQLTFKEANPRALMLVHFLQFILRLEDIGTNSGNYGQNDEGEPVIIDFWVTPKEDYTLSDNQIEDFWKNQHGSNSKIISEVMTRVPREERRKIIHEAMETWSLIRKIEEAKSAIEEFLLKSGERLETSGDISRYVRDIKTNKTSFGQNDRPASTICILLVSLDGLSEHPLKKQSDMAVLLRTADSNRKTASTKCNEYSSRSHAIYMWKIKAEQKSTGISTNSVLKLVDLAGSERAKESGVVGQQFKEMTNINQSLSVLQKCVSMQKSKSSHVPYRDSKLTQVLMDCLGRGNSKTMVMVNITPCEEQATESKRSIEFAAKMWDTHIGSAVQQREINKEITRLHPSDHFVK
ncbi:Protein CBG12680 [Caenorhabditis briggsae]|uniref:Kinesin-like protein n=2 Tax=Caenorhabditis briggsae TaxID=6238 RepID=A8XGB8_CAEBR|nr:Protein CBG12680 [Caenorhabditis briggsae]CAP31624.2 Protein CBG12680 [Caenorhabditis briggsae]